MEECGCALARDRASGRCAEDGGAACGGIAVTIARMPVISLEPAATPSSTGHDTFTAGRLR